MNPERQPLFNEAAEQFDTYAQSVRGYIRYQLVQRYIGERITGAEQLRVLDIGGGAAIDAAWLAEQGHNVTIVEPAPAQIAYAKHKLQQLPEAMADRITIFKGDLNAYDAKYPHKLFDVVLNHCVAQNIIDDPAGHIRTAARHVAPGGQFSLLEKHKQGAEVRALREHNHKQLKRIRQDKPTKNHLGIPVLAFSKPQLRAMIKDAGLVIPKGQTFGVRVHYDYDDRYIGDVKPKELAKILDDEYLRGTTKSLQADAQLLHIVAYKPLEEPLSPR